MECGPGVWMIALTVGVIALGLAMAYGIMPNRRRTPSEKALTEAATRARAAPASSSGPAGLLTHVPLA